LASGDRYPALEILGQGVGIYAALAQLALQAVAVGEGCRQPVRQDVHRGTFAISSSNQLRVMTSWLGELLRMGVRMKMNDRSSRDTVYDR
jgi:hypothetical protein